MVKTEISYNTKTNGGNLRSTNKYNNNNLLHNIISNIQYQMSSVDYRPTQDELYIKNNATIIN